MLRSRHSKRHEHTGENEPTKRKKKGAYTSQTVISTEQIKQAMKKCILSKKDNLFELLGIIINDNYLY